jgi:sugar phosphate isomerase/epimerase
MTTPPNGIRLAGAAWSWVGTTLAESVAIYRALGVRAVDLIAIPGARLDTYTIAADPAGQAKSLRELDVAFSNLLMFFGAGFQDRAVNSADATARDKNFDTFRRVLEFCSMAGVYSVTVLPGVEQPSMSRSDALAVSAGELNRMNEAAQSAGVLLVFEPHVQSILEDPRDVLGFVREKCRAKLVVDYSHAVSIGYKTDDLDTLVPFAGHVHLRQAAPDQIQARWEDGTIDFPALMSLLKETNYCGYVTLEYEHDKFWNMDRCDVMTETIKMRDAVLPYLHSP